MRIDCDATHAHHRCCLEPGHDDRIHLCFGCGATWPNADARILPTGVVL